MSEKYTVVDLSDPNVPTHMKEAVARLNALLKVAPEVVTRLLETGEVISPAIESEMDKHISTVMLRPGPSEKEGVLTTFGILVTAINTGPYRIFVNADDEPGKPHHDFGIFKVS